MNDNNYCVILAGGIGLKLWPSSKHDRPKQFLDLLGRGESLLQSTYHRIARFVSKENIIISTNEQYRQIVKSQLPDVPEQNLLLEPMRRNTLPGATWATVMIAHRNPDARILVCPADQMIFDETAFADDVMAAFDYVCRERRLLAFGRTPSRAETNYGYIQMGEELEKDIFHVKSFTEKPEAEFARLFVEDQEFLWNTGLFVWSAATFLSYVHEKEAQFPMIDHTANLIEGGAEVEKVVREAFSICPNISIERVCLERNDHTDVMRCHFGWSDLGTWHTLSYALPKRDDGNVVMSGQAMLYGCNDCIVKAPEGRVIVAQGLDDYVIVEDNNILVICKKDDQRAIRNFVNDVQITMGDEYV